MIELNSAAVVSKRRRPGQMLLGGVSSLAVCMMAVSAPVRAQSASGAGEGVVNDAGAKGEIIVTGLRRSLATSQGIKKNADTIVDAISAQDIGALPDRSVTEALQRVPGVTISRFAAANDPDHFSVEGAGVQIRGLNFVRSEFNGRDTFSANNGRSLSFADVPAELLGSVAVYKNNTADMIEGGLAGTVNLNTRRPLDEKGFHTAFSAEFNYGNFAKKATPVGSLLVSNTWETDSGTWGLLGNISYSQLKSRADGFQISNYQTRDGTTVNNPNNGAGQLRSNLPDDSGGLLPLAYAPIGAGFRTQEFDRKRFGIAAAAQWKSNDGRSEATFQYLRSQSDANWGEHTFETGGDLSDFNTFPVGCGQSATANCTPGQFTNYKYGANNTFESGYITLPGTGWRSADSGSQPRVPTGGTQQVLQRRQVQDRNVVNDFGLNMKFKANDRWAFSGDVAYVKATHDVLDFSVMGSTFADTELDLSGRVPKATLHKPNNLNASWSTPNPRIAGQSDSEFFGDVQNTFWRSAMDHQEQSEGEQWSFRGDTTYSFDGDGFLKDLKFGARYTDRDQTTRFSVYNWGALSEVWAGSPVWMEQGPGANSVAKHEFTNYFKGAINAPPVGHYYSGDLIGNYKGSAELFKSINNYWGTANGGQSGNWVPLAERPGVVAGTPFRPGEVQTVSEATIAAYAQVSFGTEFSNGQRLAGNIGVRYISTDVNASGAISVPPANAIGNGLPFNVACAPQVPPGSPPGTVPVVPPGICRNGEAAFNNAQAFSNGASFASVANSGYRYFLPSFNVKWAVKDDLIFRFAASKVLARPEMGYVRNFVQVNTDTTAGFRFTANAGNPFIKPATAWTFDLTAEWYFSKVGSLTADLFYKRIDGFFWDSVVPRDITNNGVTQTVDIIGPANFNGTGKIKGFEIAYQQTFDFLPGLLSGLGLIANYTFIDSQGLPNSFLQQDTVGTNKPPPTTGAGSMPLAGLSKHNYNLAGFYEKGPVSFRLAWSWRSEWLLTARDVIYPYYPIYNAPAGQLDASLFLSIHKNLKLGVQAVNLTNTTTKTLQQYTADGLKAPRSYFVNDSRYSFIIRGQF